MGRLFGIEEKRMNKQWWPQSDFVEPGIKHAEEDLRYL